MLFRNIRIQTTDLVAAPVDPIFVRNLNVNQISPVERAAGWRLAWDGASLAGWRSAGGTALPENAWKIERGELVSTGNGSADVERPEGAGDIVTTAQFSAFEFRFEASLSFAALRCAFGSR